MGISSRSPDATVVRYNC